MNRSFRAHESRLLDSAARQRQQLRASMMAEKDEELSMFLEMRRREKEQDSLLLNSNPDEFETPLGSKSGTSPVFNISSGGAAPARKTGPPDDFLNSEGDKNDYEWLLTPPGTPLFPSLEMESQRTMMSQNGDSKGRPATLTSRLANSSSEHATRNHLTSRQQTSSPGLSSSNGATRRPSSSGGPGSRPSSSGGPGSRPATPTGRSSSTLTTNSKSSRPSTPTSRTTTVSSSTTRPSLTSSRSTASATTRPTPPMSRSTSSSRLTPTAPKPTTRPAGSTTRSSTTSTTTRSAGPSRSTTPLSRSTARSSTPTSRPTLPPPTKTISRSATPTRRPISAATSTTSKPSQIKPSSPAAKPMPTPSKTTPAAVSRAPSPTVRSRPWKPSDMPGFSLETPPNLRTTLPERPLSATRGRPGAPSPRSNSVEPTGGGRPRRQSCSPSRGRAPMHTSGSSVPAVNRGYSKANDNVSPVLMGAKMVERVINMRKLAPPRSDEKGSPHGNLSAKSSSLDSAGFGRNLSKKSLDMAIRHMDIRRTIPGNLRPLMTNIPASSMYSVRSGHTRGRPMSVSDSPLATSSNASSEISVYNNNGMCLEAASEKEDDAGSERGCRSPASSLQGR